MLARCRTTYFPHVSYHEAPSDIWLKDFVEGAPGEGTSVEGENL